MYAYNPRKKTPQQLEKSLVGDDRWDVLDTILLEMTLEEGEKPKQHWMIVGPRGIGKSHLLTLLYYKVKATQALNKLWVPVLFPEDLRMAGNLPKFLERAANELLLDFEQEKNPISIELKRKIQEINKAPLAERADILFSIISWCHQKTGKYFLFITENLQQLLGKKISRIEQKKLRAFLQTSDSLLIIGSATTIFDALHDHSHPFYHFFHIRRLEELRFDDMKTLIISLLSESERPELIGKIKERDERLKTLYTFTGGNPRMAVFLADIIRTEAPDEMLEFMDNILDQLTPYFETILNDTPSYLEDVINTLAEFEPAQSPKEVSQHLEVPQSTMRNYLKQLKETGYVRVAFSKGKSNYYCLNEYLYRIWYQMRDSSHREETRWLMELLLMLYSPTAIAEQKNKVEARNEMEESPFLYQRYFIQAAYFIETNPDYCKVIELCVDSIINDEKKTIRPKQKDELITKAEIYLKNGQLEKAIKNCKDILTVNPKSEHAYWLWSSCLRDLGQYEEAIEKLKNSIKIDSKSYWSYGAMGDCYKDLMQYAEAEDQYRKATEINNKYEDAYRAWGHCLLLRKHHNKALEKFKKAIEINPKSSNTHELWGACLSNLGHYEEAIEKVKKAIEINPNSEQAYGLWGDCLREQEHYEEAIEKVKKAIEINPNSEQAYGLWGDCLREQEHYEEAIEKVKKAIEINPNSEQAYGLWGDCLREQEHYEEAIEKVKKVATLNPKSEHAYWLWGACLRDLGQHEEAIEKLKNSIKIDSKSYWSYGAMGDCYKRLIQYTEAEDQYRKAIEINKNYEDAYNAWGHCLLLQKRYKNAIDKFEKAAEINSNSEQAFGYWGYCLAKLERYEEAIGKIIKETENDPKSEWAYLQWGTCLQKLERYEEAIKLFKEHLSASTDSDVIYSYGSCLMGAEHFSEALKQFERLINIQPEYHRVYLPYGQLLEKKQVKEASLFAFLNYISFGSEKLSKDFDFQAVCTEHIFPLLETLKPEKYIKKFYVQENERKLSEPQLSILLVLLAKYDTVSEHIQDIINVYLEREDEDRDDFDLLIFTIKLAIWLKLRDGNSPDSLRIVGIYIEYIKALHTTKQKEDEVSAFCLGLFRMQVNLNIETDNILKVLNCLGNEDDVPFSDLFLKIWTCLSEPDSVDALRYLNDNAIAEVVKALKEKGSVKLFV